MSEQLQAVLDRLERVRGNGLKYSARCPAHEDKTASLSLAEGETWVLFHCHAGCSSQSVLDALKLTWKDIVLNGSAAPRRKRKFQRRELELEALMAAERLQGEQDALAWLLENRGWTAAALAYAGVGWNGSRLLLPAYDEQGALHDLAEYAPFPVRGPKLRGLPGRSKMPWPAPERVQTKDFASRWVLLLEGQGTALTGLSLGFPTVSLPGAVTTPTGNPSRPASFSGSGWNRAWARRLARFPRVVCIPDCDHAGRALMHAVVYDLQREGVQADVVDLGGEDGTDLADWGRPIGTPVQRRQGRELVNMLVRTSLRSPAQLEDAREIFHGFSRWCVGSFEETGGALSGVSGGAGAERRGASAMPVSSNDEPALEPLWDWAA